MGLNYSIVRTRAMTLNMMMICHGKASKNYIQSDKISNPLTLFKVDIGDIGIMQECSRFEKLTENLIMSL